MSEECPRVVPTPTLSNAGTSHLSHLIQKDSGLIITPEKFSTKQKKSQLEQDENEAPKLPPGVLITQDFPEKQSTFKPEFSDLIPTKLSSIVNDPTLDVTPEKPPTVLKQTSSKNQNSTLTQDLNLKSSRNLHVRFDVPEQSSESEIPVSETSEQSDLGGQNSKNNVPMGNFQTRAALYVQRNPLADITSDSSLQETSENTTETFTSTDTDNSSFFKNIAQFIENNGPSVADMHGKVIRGAIEVTQTLPQVKLKTTQKQNGKDVGKTTKITKSKIINVVSHEKQGPPPRSVIDKLTRPKTKSVSLEEKTFLKKKSGLHRHEHSIRYGAGVESDATLSGPTYNSTLTLGQELQELKVSEFDAKGAVKKKLAESERLRTYVAEKTAEATNINPDEKIYQNLVSVEVPEEDVLPTTASWKRMKPKPFKPKKMKHKVPDIMDTFDPKEIYYEELFIDFDWKVPAPKREQFPLEHIIDLNEHYSMWNNVNLDPK